MPAAEAAAPFTTIGPDVFSGIDLASRTTVVAAVSGGSDSLALLLLLHRLRETTGLPHELIAVTVDHGLRPEAAAEADDVAALCSSWDIRHVTRRWEAEKPLHGLANAARLARYTLLAQTAEAAGTDLVLTGHTADDLAETVAMRAARGEGIGLAGIAPATLWASRTWFVRPLITFRREALQDALRAAGISWASDPTNDDPRYERARVRAALDEADRQRLIRHGRAAGVARERLSGATASLIDQAARMVSPGLVRIERQALEKAKRDEPEAAIHALRLMLATVGGADRLPPGPAVGSLLEGGGTSGRRTALAGCIADRRKDAVFLHREWRGAGPHPLRIGAGATIFDGRFRISAHEGESVKPIGRTGASEATPAVLDAPASLARAALACEPRIEENMTAARIVAPFRLLLPSFDLAAAQALARLAGAADFAPSPCAGHKAREA